MFLSVLTLHCQNGLTQFNAVLVGTVVVSLWPVVGGGQLTPRVWGLVVVGAAVSVIVDRATAGFLSGVKASHHSTDKVRLRVAWEALL